MREGGIGNNENIWMIQRLGGPTNPVPPWSAESESSLDYIPPEWEPDESGFEDSAAADEDVSWGNSELDTEGVQWGSAHSEFIKHSGWDSSDEALGQHTYNTGAADSNAE
jgi:hypothetical protein